ncbi:MAG: hypothetical protein GY710_17205 [Desulfobacteraceae bacterium]|nr:hypothetical protein [Desulfobacteraceae bacterium]
MQFILPDQPILSDTERHKDDVAKILNRDNFAPDLILFNGSSLKSGVVQERIRSAIRHWFRLEDANFPRVLENPDPDISVASWMLYMRQ